MFKKTREIFSIRKFKNGRSDSIKIGSLALLLGASLAFGGDQADAKTIEIDKKFGPAVAATTAPEVDLGEKHFLAISEDNATLDDFVAGQEASERISKEATLELEYRFIDQDTNQQITAPQEESATTYEVSHETVRSSRPAEYKYDELVNIYKDDIRTVDLADNIDGKEYASNQAINVKEVDKYKYAVDKPQNPSTAIAGEIKSLDNKKYEYVRTEVIQGEPTFNETFNNVNIRVTTDRLHTDDAEINYANIPATSRVFLVEELSERNYGKVVLANAITSDQDIADKFYAGENTAQVLSQEELDRLGGIKENDYIIVFDRDNYSHKSAGGNTIPPFLFREGTDYMFSPPYFDIPARFRHGTPSEALSSDYKELIKYSFDLDVIEGVHYKVKDIPSFDDPEIDGGVIEFSVIGETVDGYKQILIKYDEFGRPIRELSLDVIGAGADIYYDDIYYEDIEEGPGEEYTTFSTVHEGSFLIGVAHDYLTTLTPLRAYKVGARDTIVNHYYKLKPEEVVTTSEKKGWVEVEYVNEAGEEIQKAIVDTPETVVEITKVTTIKSGDVQIDQQTQVEAVKVNYNTEDKRPQRLVTPDGKIYQYIRKEEGQEAGLVAVGKTKVVYVYREVVTSKPTEPLTIELPLIPIDSKVPKDFPTIEKPEGNIGLVPKDFPTIEKPEGNIGLVPKDFPTIEKPEGNIGLVPKDFLTIEKPEGNIGLVPKDFPTIEKPEGIVGLVPKDFLTIEKPEGNIGLVPKDFPTIEKPEGNIGLVPKDFLTIEKPEGNIGLIPKASPNVALSNPLQNVSTARPELEKTKGNTPTLPISSRKENVEIGVSKLPKTSAVIENNFALSTGFIASLIGAGLLVKRRRKDD